MNQVGSDSSSLALLGVDLTSADPCDAVALRSVMCAAGSEQYLDSLRREYEVSCRLRHASLRRSYGFWERRFSGDIVQVVLASEPIRGVPLSECEPRSLLEALDWLIQIAEALAALHDAGYVHGSLGQHTIWVNHDNRRIKLVDCGQAEIIGESACQRDLCDFARLANQLLNATDHPQHQSIRQGVRERVGGFLCRCLGAGQRGRRPHMSEVARRLGRVRTALGRDEGNRRRIGLRSNDVP